MPPLRLVTCGSVDDGKSTLIGRLLYESKGIFEDQLAAVEKASAKHGTTGAGTVDLALVTDGLKAEREQGITIDVAYRYFSTPRRKFVIADSPGHEQYTRNMATGASTADLAVLLIDARKGVITQTRRHSFIVSLLGIRHVVVAVNKMDLVGWSRPAFESIASAARDLARELGIPHVRPIPMSALGGDNVTAPSPHTPWYDGPTLLSHLEEVDVGGATRVDALRLPVQYVSRPDATFRGYMGTVAAGVARPGDLVVVLPSGLRTRVAKVYDPDGERESVRAGEAVTLTLADEVDVSRGETIAAADAPPMVAARFAADLVWLSTDPLVPGKRYRVQHASRVTPATVAEIEYRVDVNTLARHARPATLEVNGIARVIVESARPLAFDAYRDCRATGAFIVVDPATNATAGAGMIVGPAERERRGTGPVTSAERAARLRQRPATVRLGGDVEVARAAAVLLDRLLFDAGHLAALVDPPAVDAVRSAGLIAVVVGEGPDAPVARDVGADDEPREVARALLGALRDAGVLDPQPTDFEI